MLHLPSLLLLVACSTGQVDGDQATTVEPACPHDTSSWRVSPAVLVSHSDADGAFSFDPPGVDVALREGSFDTQSGDLAWTDSYVDGHKYVSASVQGTAFIEEDGDYSADFTTVVLDVLGRTFETGRSLSQEGCEQLATIDPADDSGGYPDSYTWTSTIVSADEVQEHLETTWNDLSWVEDRTDRSDLSTTYTIVIDDGTYDIAGTYAADGSHHRDMVQLTDSQRLVVSYDYAIDGSQDQHREGYGLDSGDLEFTFDGSYLYDGSGQGTYVMYDDEGVVTCVYSRGATLDEDCSYTYECDDGNVYTGEC